MESKQNPAIFLVGFSFHVMMYRFVVLFLFIPLFSISQNDLLDEIDTDSVPNRVDAVFKSLKIVNLESTKLVAKKGLLFNVSHRFGSIENGFDTFFGLDDAVTRIQFIYGISEDFNIGFSRSSYQKIYEGFVKYRLVRQSEKMPFTIVGFNSIMINTAMEKVNLPRLAFKHRLSYATQLLVSRKFNENLSMELAPTFFHDNFVVYKAQDNAQFAVGLGGRYKLGKRWSVNVDYAIHLNRAEGSPYNNPLSVGIDLETGGHVFQMHFTNAQPMNVNGFLGQASGDWSIGTIFFGFNLTRSF